MRLWDNSYAAPVQVWMVCMHNVFIYTGGLTNGLPVSTLNTDMRVGLVVVLY